MTLTQNWLRVSGPAVCLKIICHAQLDVCVRLCLHPSASCCGGWPCLQDVSRDLAVQRKLDEDHARCSHSLTVCCAFLQAIGTCGTALATSLFAGNAAGTGGAVYLSNYGRLGSCERGSCRCPPESRTSPAFDRVRCRQTCSLEAVYRLAQPRFLPTADGRRWSQRAGLAPRQTHAV